MPEKSNNGEQGFTLVELLIAITLSGLLISAMAFGFIATMRGTAGAHDRFVASNGNHTLATYFASDVQSANATLVSTDPTSNSGCATTEASTTNVLRLQWWEQPTLTKLNAFSVSYRTRQVGSTWQLMRYACSGSQDPFTTDAATATPAILAAATPTSQVIVAELYDSSPSSPYRTLATNTGREVTLKAYTALAEDETVPYDYTVSASLRTLSGGTTTTTTTSSSSTTSSSTTTSSTTTTTTAPPTTATSLGFVSCVRSDGPVSCAGPITLAKDQWVDVSVQLLDSSGNPVNATSNTTVEVSSTNTKFEVTGAPVTVAAGSSQSSGPFRVTHTNAAGSATITVTSGSLNSASIAMSTP